MSDSFHDKIKILRSAFDEHGLSHPLLVVVFPKRKCGAQKMESDSIDMLCLTRV